MGKKRKITSVKELEELWEEYKEYCNDRKVLTHGFSSKNSKFVSAELKRSVTYTIAGFCVFAGISRAAFYKNYSENKKYVDTVTRMREECEIDAREKFELGIIPSQLAGLWMSNYGYSTKTELDKQEQNTRKEYIKAQTDKITGDNAETEDLSEIEAEIYGKEENN